MFLKKNNLLYSPNFLHSSLFCLLWFSLLLPAGILSLRYGMQQLDGKSCTETLNFYLRTYQQQGITGLQKKISTAAHQKTIFLHLQTKNNQLFLVAAPHGDKASQLPNVSDIDVHQTGTWLQLNDQAQEYWTITLKKLPNNTILQVGIRTTETVILYQRLKKTLLLIWLFMSPLALIRAWLLFLNNQKKFSLLTQKIHNTAGVTSESGEGRQQLLPGEKGLLQAVNHLIGRHQLLTRQLQETMDNVSHDLRTPVTRLRTIAEYGLQEKGDAGQLRERLTDCLEESDRLLSMLNTMLSVAEAEAQSMALNLQAVDIRNSIAEVVELYTIVGEEKHCSLAVDDTGPVMALVDQNRIGQVWANLVDNAIKYGASEVRIHLQQEKDQAVITISDNGMGISETERELIWNRLFRGDRSRSQPGLGLGLTLTNAIVKAHSGTITVQSKLNSGTVFTIALPRTHGS